MLQTALLSGIRAFQKPKIETIYQFLSGNNYLIENQTFDISKTPYLKEIYKDFSKTGVREIILIAPVQSGKSKLQEALILYSLKKRKGNILYFHQSQEFADDFSESYITPAIRKFKPTKELLHANSDYVTKNKIILATHKFLRFLSGNNKKHLQSFPCETQFGDEVAQWKEGFLDEARKRTRRYDKTTAKRVYISTPELQDKQEGVATDLYHAFSRGNMAEWSILCEKCNKTNKLNHAHFKYNVKLYNEGEFDKFDNSIRFICEHCKHEHFDTPKTRRRFSETGHYVNENDKHHPEFRSYHYTGFAVTWNKWSTLITEFIDAEKHSKLGSYDKLKEVVRKNFGEFWKPIQFLKQELKITKEFEIGYFDHEGENPFKIVQEKWEKEAFRFLIVDVQKDHFWAIIRLWDNEGNSRLLWCGKVDTFDNLRAIQLENNIHDLYTFIDGGFGRSYQNGSSFVDSFATKYGWNVLLGSDLSKFSWRIKDSKAKVKTVYKPFSTVEKHQVFYEDLDGKQKNGICRKYYWSNPIFKDILYKAKTGDWIRSFGISWDVPNYYKKQMNSEERKTRIDKYGREISYWEQVYRHNHLWDCEAMGLVPAMSHGLLKVD